MRSRFSATAALALALLSSACGFHLRGADNPVFTQKLYLEGQGATETFVGIFGKVMRDTGGKMATSLADANGVVYLHQVSFLRRPITLSRTGRATEYDLIYRISYDIRNPAGEILQPRQEVELRRDYFNDQSLPLAQTAEENLIRQDLEREVVQLLLRRAAYALKSPAS